MTRKEFLSQTAATTAAFFLPNVVWAGEKLPQKTADLLPTRMFQAKQDLSDCKFNADGEPFFKTQLSFLDQNQQYINLPEPLYISADLHGYGTPTLLFDGTTYHIFVPTLFKAYKMNGHIYSYNHDKGFTCHELFMHENQGWYAFWGKFSFGRPALYHLDYANGFLMRSVPVEEGRWVTERMFNGNDNQMIRLYNSQLKDVNYHTQAHQYGFEPGEINDDVFTILKLMQRYLNADKIANKHKEAELEAKYPSCFSTQQKPNLQRVIRNRQSLSAETGGCGCADNIDYTRESASHLRIQLKPQRTKGIDKAGRRYYPTEIKIYTQQNKMIALGEPLLCLGDGQHKSLLYDDGQSHYLYTEAWHEDAHRGLIYRTDAQNKLQLWQSIALINPSQSVFLSKGKDVAPMLYAYNPLVGLQEYSFEAEKPISQNIAVANTDFIYHQQPIINIERIKYQWNTVSFTEKPETLVVVYSTEDIMNLIEKEDRISKNYITKDLINAKFLALQTRTNQKVEYFEGKTQKGSLVEVPNMPSFENQDTLAECRALSLRTIYQKFVCDELKIPNCANPPDEYNISSIGLMSYTNVPKDQAFEITINGENYYALFETLKNIKDRNGNVFLNSCKDFSTFLNNFTQIDPITKKGTGQVSEQNQADFDAFLKRLEAFYTNCKTDQSTTDCKSCLIEINRIFDAEKIELDIKKALTKKTFSGFLYKLFFGRCPIINMPHNFTPAAYPYDQDKENGKNPTIDDFKKVIDKKLKEGKPLLTQFVCLKRPIDDYSKNNCVKGQLHAMIISGQKLICDSNNRCKLLYKVHNSWGEQWQRNNNDGWVDAEKYINSFERDKNGKFSAESLVWLDREG